MALFRYFKPVAKPTLPEEVSLLEKKLCDVNAKVKAATAEEKQNRGKERNITIILQSREHHLAGTLLNIALYFSKTMDTELPETTARRFKKEYLNKISKNVIPVTLLAQGCQKSRHCQPKVKVGHYF